MALDEPKENDEVFDVNGFQFIMEKEFYDKAQPVKVDFLGYGFKIDSSIEFDASDSACGSCSTSGGCGEEKDRFKIQKGDTQKCRLFLC